MPLQRLDNLVRTGQLKAEQPARADIEGLIHSGSARIKDAENATLSLESRFDLAYNAAHALSLAALGYHGYRSESRYLVFPPQYVPPQSNGAIAQVVAIDATSGSVTVPIMPTRDGDRIYVLLTGAEGFVHDIGAGASRVDLLMDFSSYDCAHRWAWGWVSPGVDAGIDNLAISADSAASYSGYALIFSGLSPGMDIVIGQTEEFGNGASGDAVAPPLPTARGNVTLSSIATCGSVSPDLTSSTFVGMPAISGVSLAYAIADGPKQPVAAWSLHDQDWMTYSLVLH